MVTITGLVLSDVHAEEFFPIGAWFPEGSLDRTTTQLNAIFDDVVAANFNVVHGPLIGDTERSDGNPSAVQPVTRVRDFLNAADSRRLKVQLYSWNFLPSWLTEGIVVSVPWDVLDPRFSHQGYGQDVNERAIVAQAGVHNQGYMLTTNLGWFGANGGFDIQFHYQYHLFRLSINDNSPGEAVVRLQILDTADTDRRLV